MPQKVDAVLEALQDLIVDGYSKEPSEAPYVYSLAAQMHKMLEPFEFDYPAAYHPKVRQVPLFEESYYEPLEPEPLEPECVTFE